MCCFELLCHLLISLKSDLNNIRIPEHANFMSKEWMEKKEAALEARRTHVKEVCEKFNLKDHQRVRDQGRPFWFDIRHGFAFCVHAKV